MSSVSRAHAPLALVALLLVVATSANALPPTKPVTVENVVAIDGTVSVDNFPPRRKSPAQSR